MLQVCKQYKNEIFDLLPQNPPLRSLGGFCVCFLQLYKIGYEMKAHVFLINYPQEFGGQNIFPWEDIVMDQRCKYR